MSHPWFLGGVGFLKKEKLKNLLGTNFINYDGPIHLASSEQLVKDKNILSGAIYLNADEDNKMYKEIQNILIDDCVVIPAVDVKVSSVRKKKISGLKSNPAYSTIFVYDLSRN